MVATVSGDPGPPDTRAAFSPSELGTVNGKLHRFAVDQHELLSCFAACKFAKNGKGALCVFTNCGLDELLVEEDEPGFTDARALRRQMLLVWGGFTDKASGDCTLAKLLEKVSPDLQKNVEKSIDASCTRETFPLVVLAGIQFATLDVLEGLRVPLSKMLGKEGHCVMSVKYGEFREALKCGLGHAFEEACVVELDDDEV